MNIRKKYMLLKRVQNERGSLLLAAYFIILVLVGLSASFLLLSVNESKISERQRLATIAFHITEAGIERGLYDLRLDFVNDTTNPSWSDGDINSYSIGPDTNNYYSIPYSSTSLNNGSYTVELKNVLGSVDDVWLKATGSISNVTHVIEVYVRMVSLSPWEYAIFAGAGASGTMINGNVDIRGSVIILGDGLDPGDYAIDLGGTSEIVGNNYNGIDGTILPKIPALPTTVFNGETVSTLHAELRVKSGLVGISGGATVGEPDVTANSVKETVDGVFVTDGYGGNQGVAGVYSDNGTSNAYDLDEAVVFPSLSDPHPNPLYNTYQDYLKGIGYVVTAVEAAQLANILPTSNFTIGDTDGSITIDGNGNMTVDGIVYIDNGGNLGFAKDGSNTTINYTGTGTVLATGNAQIDVNLVTAGSSSFPSNIIGIMTPNDIGFNEANINVMGVFYGENKIVVQKQTDIVGTIAANYFDMGTNVPAIYQVPETVNNLPPGLIGADTQWYLVVAWLKSQ